MHDTLFFLVGGSLYLYCDDQVDVVFKYVHIAYLDLPIHIDIFVKGMYLFLKLF